MKIYIICYSMYIVNVMVIYVVIYFSNLNVQIIKSFHRLSFINK